MKATINGIAVEGSPEEIAQVIKLVGEAVKVQPCYVPVPYYPSQPIHPWDWTKITCDSSYQGTTKTSI